ncbi:hypothetical protein LP414_11660 [Polaromonas sp. P1(28)-13]|nr:hypothetical protein LP414_11660 [Polaromonas sp. P1(28)-13]
MSVLFPLLVERPEVALLVKPELVTVAGIAVDARNPGFTQCQSGAFSGIGESTRNNVITHWRKTKTRACA